MPAFRDIVLNRKVYVVDELERSMHPVIAKELISKFSRDADTKGQLVFTTHESNLLDQSIFRQDEIWFAEKGPMGNTSLYSLSDFKEHNTIDIRKGYLNGRYGAVPFTADLQELNWHQYETN
jgi:AAA15 family ATPase/GTPase